MTKKCIIVLIISLIAAFGIWKYLSKMQRKPAFDSGTLHCALDIKAFDDTTGGLISGYNYLLLKRFADSLGLEAEIRLTDVGESCIDSLSEDLLDILVIPCGDIPISDLVVASKSIDSLTYWVTSSRNIDRINLINEWIDNWEGTNAHDSLFGLFINVYEPFKLAKNGEHRSQLGPYDELIKSSADTLGWDWRLLTAVVFQESRFHINAKSHKGASGLMQVMPRTANSLSVGNLLDPEENIKAGVKYLGRLQKMFAKYASSRQDLQKFALAAYNIGDSRLKEILDNAIAEGKECNTWDQLAELLPVEETSVYIKKIYDYYWAFCRIYREPANDQVTLTGQTGQDQPSQ